jgi:hypothetical protein
MPASRSSLCCARSSANTLACTVGLPPDAGEPIRSFRRCRAPPPPAPKETNAPPPPPIAGRYNPVAHHHRHQMPEPACLCRWQSRRRRILPVTATRRCPARRNQTHRYTPVISAPTNPVAPAGTPTNLPPRRPHTHPRRPPENPGTGNGLSGRRRRPALVAAVALGAWSFVAAFAPERLPA